MLRRRARGTLGARWGGTGGAIGAPPAPPSTAGYYVSLDGNASWAQAASMDNPCSTATAFAYAAAGDIVYFRGGTYSLTAYGPGGPPPPCANKPANSGTVSAPITFKAFPGEAAIWNAVVALEEGDADFLTWYDGNGQPSTKGAASFPVASAVVLSVQYRNYITIDGFVFQANGGTKIGVPTLNLYGTTGVIVQNCTFSAFGTLPDVTWPDTTHRYDNVEFLRVDESSGARVTRCTFTNLWQTNGLHNASAIKTYGNAGLTIDHCNASHCTAGFYIKSHHNDDVLLQQNWIDGCRTGLLIGLPVSNAYGSSDRLTVQHNLITNSTYAPVDTDVESAVHGNDWVFVSNTIYGGSAGMPALQAAPAEAGHGTKIYDNLIHGVSRGLWTRNGNVLAEEDHNQWGTGTHSFAAQLYAPTHEYASLAEWQASTELEDSGNPGGSDLESDPVFANGSGTLAQIADFEPTAAATLTGSRTGGVLGCDLTRVGAEGAA